jgi:hypothetical protein
LPFPGSPEESGDVHLVFDFQGPPGIAYPQFQPSVDSYDERHRVNIPGDVRGKLVEEEAKKGKPAAKPAAPR